MILWHKSEIGNEVRNCSGNHMPVCHMMQLMQLGNIQLSSHIQNEAIDLLKDV